MKQEISKKTMKALEKIAMEKSSVLEERGGIERRWSDEQDFPEIAIWSIEEMLIAAYNLGRKDAKEGKYHGKEHLQNAEKLHARIP